jgi:hypothetical protein
MLNILIDTNVWRNWFTLKVAPDRLQNHPNLLVDSRSFDEIYSLATSSLDVTFLFNYLVPRELGDNRKSEVSEYVLPVAKKIPIPLTRADGGYCDDGSVLHGGRMGGCLKVYLEFEGYQQEAEIMRAATALGDKPLYEENPRKREFDVEHMESALEAEADLFVTSDYKIIDTLDRLKRHLERFKDGHDALDPVNRIWEITKTPTDALPLIKAHLDSCRAGRVRDSGAVV